MTSFTLCLSLPFLPSYWLIRTCVGMPSLESLVPKTVSDAWSLREAPETFTRETLFEHIDGKPIYLISRI